MPYLPSRESNRIVSLLERYRKALLANSGRNDSARFDFAAGLQVYEYIFEQLGTSVRGYEEMYEELADGLSPVKYTEDFLSIASTLTASFTQVSNYLRRYSNFLHLLRLVSRATTPHPQWLTHIPQEMKERDWEYAGDLERSKEQLKIVWKICRFANNDSSQRRSIRSEVMTAIEELKRSILPPPRPSPRDLDTFTPEELDRHFNPRGRASSVSSLE